MTYSDRADQFVRDYREIDNQIIQLQAELERKKEWKAQADALMKACYGDAVVEPVADEVGAVATKPIRKRAVTKPKQIEAGDKNDAALIEALQETKDVSKDFVTADKLFEVALTNGFSLSRVSVRNRMAKLVKAHPDRIIEQKTPALAWRLA